MTLFINSAKHNKKLPTPDLLCYLKQQNIQHYNCVIIIIIIITIISINAVSLCFSIVKTYRQWQDPPVVEIRDPIDYEHALRIMLENIRPLIVTGPSFLG